MAFLKPQNPIKKGEDFVYPLTTVDQIILDDNSRLNSKVVTVDLNTENDEISELQTNVVVQMENDVSKTLKEYSISYVIKDSTCNVVTINNGISGVEILFDSEYLYEDGSILQAKNYMYMFSSKENIITIIRRKMMYRLF